MRAVDFNIKLLMSLHTLPKTFFTSRIATGKTRNILVTLQGHADVNPPPPSLCAPPLDPETHQASALPHRRCTDQHPERNLTFPMPALGTRHPSLSILRYYCRANLVFSWVRKVDIPSALSTYPAPTYLTTNPHRLRYCQIDNLPHRVHNHAHANLGARQQHSH